MGPSVSPCDLVCVQVTMPKDNIHHGGVEHREMHNLNGALFHAATWQGLEERGRASYGSDGDRPFILSRSAFAGTQRLGALWTGDNKAEWPALKFSVPMCLSLSIAGLPFVGVLLACPLALIDDLSKGRLTIRTCNHPLDFLTPDPSQLTCFPGV